MSEIVGHDDIIESLSQGIPPVSIFLGEDSVGKWTTAMWVRDRLKIQDGDFLALRHLSADSARAAGDFVKRAPHGHTRLLVVYMAGSGWSTQAMLLTSLENLPPTSLVILVTPPVTLSDPLMSRGEVFVFGLLRVQDVKQILLARNFKEGAAQHLAELSGGHVATALRAAGSNDAKVLVLGAVRALLTRDAKALDTFAPRWAEEHTLLLDSLCRETISGRLCLFTEEETEALGRKLALKILTLLRVEVRPRLVIHSQLMSVLRGE
jgi:replication-associated recombination protein RarA